MSRSLREHPLEEGQTSPISRARSHHQNGKAKRGMKTTMGSARTMSPHSASHWSDTEDAGPWSVSVQQAVWINNHLLSRNAGLSPHDLWSKTKHPLQKSHIVNTFGHPVHVCPSDRMSAPRWEKRFRQGVHVRMSERHAGNVPLILNFKTGNITAQWNVAFDD